MEPSYTIAVEERPSRTDVEAISRGLADFNHRHADDDGYQPLAVLLRDAGGALVGGLTGQTFWGWLHVDLLWVAEGVRGQGHGSRLLAAAEAEAVRRGCAHAFLDTQSFQAPSFYRKRGYVVFGELPDFPTGHTRHFLTKRLGPAPSTKPDGAGRP